MTLRWSYVTGALGYDVYAGGSAGTLAIALDVTSGSTTNATLTGLTNDQLTFFAVSARGQGGSSTLSNVLSATPRAPALDVSSPVPDAGATVPPGCRDTAPGCHTAAHVTTEPAGTSAPESQPTCWASPTTR